MGSGGAGKRERGRVRSWGDWGDLNFASRGYFIPSYFKMYGVEQKYSFVNNISFEELFAPNLI